MKRWHFGVAVLALLLGVVGQTRAGLIPPGGGGAGGGGGAVPGGIDPAFTFTFSDIQGDMAHGTLNAVPSGLGDGSLWVTSGTLIVTRSSDSNASVGTYSLLSAGPNPETSPSGLFVVDNLIYPANDAASGVNPAISSNPSYLTNWGLLFGHPGTGSQDEINIWGNGAGDYAFYAETGGNYTIPNGAGGTFVLTPVPEPASLTLLGIGIAGMAGYAVRRRNKAVA